MSEKRVALITGGASGMGLSVATALSKLQTWDIHILDLPSSPGPQVAQTLPSTTFHPCDVTSYTSLQTAFQTIHSKSNRLDFVFANAGIAEHANFFAEQSDPPPEPKGLHALVDINLKSVINTSSLALHYMRKSASASGTETRTDKSLVMTASCGGLYPSYYSPIYTATKHALVGFMRSIAPYYHAKAGIRVNAICPGTVKTNLLSGEEWKSFPEEYFTPVEKIARVVGMLVEGRDRGEGRGDGNAELGVLKGKAVEISGWKHYYREQVGFCDEAMEAVMGATNVEALKGVDGK